MEKTTESMFVLLDETCGGDGGGLNVGIGGVD